ARDAGGPALSRPDHAVQIGRHRARGSRRGSAGAGARSGMSGQLGVSVKICGLSTAEAVGAAVAGGADFLGFVFYAPSPRNVTPERAAALCAAVPQGRLSGPRRVGLFVDADDAAIAAALAAAPLDILQFHGSETPERVAAARRRFGKPVMKALKIAETADVAAAEP